MSVRTWCGAENSDTMEAVDVGPPSTVHEENVKLVKHDTGIEELTYLHFAVVVDIVPPDCEFDGHHSWSERAGPDCE